MLKMQFHIITYNQKQTPMSDKIPSEIMEKIEEFLNDGEWGYPDEDNKSGKWMFEKLKQAMIDGYTLASNTIEGKDEFIEKLKQDIYDLYEEQHQQSSTIEGLRAENEKLKVQNENMVRRLNHNF